ncbi:hypothetical protein ACWDQL_34235 [Streptomyces olivaceus]
MNTAAVAVLAEAGRTKTDPQYRKDEPWPPRRELKPSDQQVLAAAMHFDGFLEDGAGP